ncbi:uncharacterized protein LOC117222999 [Megalopta genalis]|uniref:uncharacterized protein LOC117222999 n=1 Tax=Megalopta genalis TaxID=115081 RepID=UPI0014437EBF|nr:uncharacterized protein LOC117222999 [Megalopta genalis]
MALGTLQSSHLPQWSISRETESFEYEDTEVVKMRNGQKADLRIIRDDLVVLLLLRIPSITSTSICQRLRGQYPMPQEKGRAKRFPSHHQFSGNTAWIMAKSCQIILVANAMRFIVIRKT